MTAIPTPQDAPRDDAADAAGHDYTAADVLVEDVSIDGMCGVY